MTAHYTTLHYTSSFSRIVSSGVDASMLASCYNASIVGGVRDE